MLRKKFSYKDTNKQFTIRNRYSHIPQSQNNNYIGIGNTVNSRLINSTIKEPILTHSRRENLSTNEVIPNEIDNINKDSSDGINYLNENQNAFIEEYPLDDEYTTDSDNLESQSENLEGLQNELEERYIIDDALDPSKLPNNLGNFSPYFDNTTSALLFCWIQKHNICK